MRAEVDVLSEWCRPLCPKLCRPVIGARLAAHVHYLYFTGELDVIELAVGRAALAAAGAGITPTPAV